MTIYLALPAYNEEQSLGPLLDAVADARASFGAPLKVIVVDDGSSDATARVAAGHPLATRGAIEVISHERNLGLAAAVNTGIDAFLARSDEPDDVMVTMDADNTHNPSYIPAMVEKVREGAGLVICSRFVEGGREMGVSAFRRLLSRGAKKFMDAIAPIPGVKDISCGYRAYSRAALLNARRVYGAHLVQSTGGAVQAELLVRLVALGERVEEIPFTLRYDLKQGPSKLGMVDTIKGYFPLRTIKKQSVAEAALMGKSPPDTPDGEGVLAMICTYNERENIVPLIKRVFDTIPNISVLVVDDASPDGTGELVERAREKYPRLNVLRRPGKLGLGSAITDGMTWGKERGFRYVVNMDADFSHDPASLPEILRRARTSDYVIGSRYVPGGGTINWGLHRRLLSRGGNAFARLALGVPISDVTTGYRCVKTDRLDDLRLDEIDAKGYGFLTVMTFRAVQAGLSTHETPIRFLDRRYGASKMSADIIGEAILLVIRLRGERKKRKK